MKNSNTEDNILRAATAVFQKRGLAGARMQEIADEARINKAMLHYYYRSKQKLFEAVFIQAFKELVPHINGIFNSEATVFEKIRRFVDRYISFVMENPFLPTFLIQEINNNPEFAKTFFSANIAPKPILFEQQISEEIKNGNLLPVDPKQLLLNLISLSAFPFVGRGLVKEILKLDDQSFQAMMVERKSLIAELIINSIKA
ncbi:TetR/AcrR family transcriptional regulator [Flavobacteriaceae bacterium F89]|uniref:TetR/AcrR family transcriptional regulator n=1 Tax=Cerina litoralis TaxID=2874477 RepID=A0AAE3JNN6_9FLAO|nr:TetR/AcrR family transcriptional regulator [Cerina litoralis]MCG2460019.1 TetR/AcrR family transcriptional regulator [Cerina litoralis]